MANPGKIQPLSEVTIDAGSEGSGSDSVVTPAQRAPLPTCEQMPILLIHPGFGNSQTKSFYTGCTIKHFQQPGSPKPEACRAACCANPECRSWGLDLRYPGSDSSCATGQPCCWLERCTGLASVRSTNCSYGCVSGQAGRVDDPAVCKPCTSEVCASCLPAPPPPPVCPNQTAPANVARTGCDARQVAAANYTACHEACCGATDCAAWNWDSVLPVGLAPAACKAAGAPCTMLLVEGLRGARHPSSPGQFSIEMMILQ